MRAQPPDTDLPILFRVNREYRVLFQEGLAGSLSDLPSKELASNG